MDRIRFLEGVVEKQSVTQLVRDAQIAQVNIPIRLRPLT
jgi:hypothetical protein